MTTGAIIFLVLIAALVLVFGAVILWHCCDIKYSIDQSEINRCIEFEEAKKAIDKSVKGCRDTIDSGYGDGVKSLLYGFEKSLISNQRVYLNPASTSKAPRLMVPLRRLHLLVI